MDERQLQAVDDSYLGPGDGYDVLKALHPVAARWSHVGGGLRVSGPTIARIDAHYRDPTECLREMVDEWLKNLYVEKYGPPSWRKVVAIVADPAGGNNMAEAKKIAAKHPAMYGNQEDRGSVRYTMSCVQPDIGELVRHKLGSSAELVNEEWYHGNMTPECAYKALITSPDGTFLVRNSTSYNEWYILCVKHGAEVSEFYIEVAPKSSKNKCYEIQGTNKPFHSLPALVNFYKVGEHRISVDGEVLKWPYQTAWNNFPAEDAGNTNHNTSFSSEHKSGMLTEDRPQYQPMLAGQEETDYRDHEICDHGWYHRKITTQTAHERLTMAPEGSYLIHDSNYPSSYTLWVKYERGETPFLVVVTVTSEGEILYSVEKTGVYFSTVGDLVSHFTENRLPWPGNLLLRTPRMRPGWKTETSEFTMCLSARLCSKEITSCCAKPTLQCCSVGTAGHASVVLPASNHSVGSVDVTAPPTTCTCFKCYFCCAIDATVQYSH